MKTKSLILRLAIIITLGTGSLLLAEHSSARRPASSNTPATIEFPVDLTILTY